MKLFVVVMVGLFTIVTGLSEIAILVLVLEYGGFFYTRRKVWVLDGGEEGRQN
jgi:hypothetical protein